jgi:single-stranded-DNA-specific exonuclease
MVQSLTGSRRALRWLVTPPADAELVGILCERLRISREVAALLVTRGYGDPEAAKRFLRPSIAHLHDPMVMRGMSAAVERLVRAIRAGETVLVHGDYDVDGICSTALMVRVLRRLGARALAFIPHRLRDGYDLSQAGVEAALAARAGVVLTCDCGTSALQPVARLVAAGVDVIVADHHLASAAPPQCVAVLNPRLPGCDYPDKDLCAAGIAFKLAVALLTHMGESANVAYNMLDLVALATVADVAPLRGENRVLVRYGLRLLARSRLPGVRALLEAAGLEGKPLTAGRVGFILAPRLNAVGRMDWGLRGVELLLTDDEGEARRLAREFEELNRRRQDLDKQTLDSARRLLEERRGWDRYGVVLACEGWHPGVIGIVASRLVEEIHRPVVLIALDGDVGKGSGRSIPAFDLHAGLSHCSDLLLRFGGHRAAAGLTVLSERVAELEQRFDAVASRWLGAEDLHPELRVDLEVPLESASDSMERLLRHFEPCGVGNPAPLLASRGVRIVGEPRIVGQNGLKLRLESGHSELEAIWWGAAERASELADGAVVDVAFRLEQDVYYDRARLVARLADVR